MAPPRDSSLRYPGGRRAAWGVLGALVTYGVAFLVTTFRRSRMVEGLTLEWGWAGSTDEELVHPQYVDFSTLADWELAGIVFYNAQFAPLDIPAEVFEGQTGVETFNLVLNAGGALLLLVVVPVIAYTVSGAAGTRNVPARTARGRGYAGMLQFTGVLPVAVLGVVVFSFSVTDGSAGPSLLWAPVLAGFVYPAVGGFVGGYLAASLQDESAVESNVTGSWGD